MEQKISGNSFRKFRASFLEIWKFRKFPVPFGISTRYESASIPLIVKSYKMVASLPSRHYTGCQNDRLDRLFSTQSFIGSGFLENCKLVVPDFLWVRSPGLHTLPREKFVSLITHVRVNIISTEEEFYILNAC